LDFIATLGNSLNVDPVSIVSTPNNYGAAFMP
jgi:hypothetical protein